MSDNVARYGRGPSATRRPNPNPRRSSMAQRWDHLELTFPPGFLTRDTRADIDAFWCGIFGWTSSEQVVYGHSCHMLRPDDGQFILLGESSGAMEPAPEIPPSSGLDVFVPHMGIRCDTIEDVDRLYGECLKFQEKDPRVRLRDFPLERYGTKLARNFLVNYVMPFWFDVNGVQADPATEPTTAWRYTA
jgi:hypothetical protein